MVKIEDLKVVTEHSFGMYGTIYKVKDDQDNYYALKIEHYITEDIHNDEIKFAQEMGSKYPDHFMTLYDYQFVDKCEHTQKYPVSIKNLAKASQKLIKKLAKSEKCVSKLYTFIDTDLKHYTFDNIYETYSIIVQLLYIMKLLGKHHYAYTDLHAGNIGLKYTDKTFIIINGHKVPTFGRLVYLIDYGAILHKDKLTKKQKYEYDDFHKFKYSIIFNMFFDNNFGKYIMDNNIKFNWQVEAKKFMKMPIYKTLMKIVNDVDFAFFLYQHLYPEEFQKGFLKDKFKGVIEDTMHIPLADYIFIYGANDERIIDYYIKKLKN